MKVLASFILSLCMLTLSAQDSVHRFQTSQVNINKKGEKIETSTVEPCTITVDLAASTVTVETGNVDIRELFREKMVLNIDRQMGDIGPQYSLQLDQFIFAHFYLNMGMIIFTRNDIHPLEWGVQFLEIQKM